MKLGNIARLIKIREQKTAGKYLIKFDTALRNIHLPLNTGRIPLRENHTKEDKIKITNITIENKIKILAVFMPGERVFFAAFISPPPGA